jgi:long-subunit fatty acid transport protein
LTPPSQRSLPPRERSAGSRWPVLAAIFASELATSPPLYAEGYFQGTYGARSLGRAGAFTVKADDLSAATWNPAGLARIEGTLLHVGNRISYNALSFTRAPTLDWGNPNAGVPPFVEFPEVDNLAPWQALAPQLGIASSLGLDDWRFALGVHAPPGVARERFPSDGGQRYMMIEREVLMLDFTASAAYRHGDSFAVGASFHWISVPRLQYELVIDANQFPAEVNPVISELDMRTRVSGSDPFTPNATVGAWWRPLSSVELGLALQVIPAAFTTRSTLTIEPLSPAIEEDVELRRDGAPADDVRLTLPLPLTARAGVRYRHLEGTSELFDIELDIGYETWSRVRRFALDANGLLAQLFAQRLDLGSIAVEKHWRDTLSLRLGGDWATLPEELTLRGGLFYESAVADPSYAHVDFASGAQLGAALGASVFVHDIELAIAYQYRHQLPVEVTEGDARVLQETPSSSCQPPFTDPNTCHPQYLGRRAPAVNAGRYLAHSHMLGVDVLYRF